MRVGATPGREWPQLGIGLALLLALATGAYLVARAGTWQVAH